MLAPSVTAWPDDVRMPRPTPASAKRRVRWPAGTRRRRGGPL